MVCLNMGSVLRLWKQEPVPGGAGTGSPSSSRGRGASGHEWAWLQAGGGGKKKALDLRRNERPYDGMLVELKSVDDRWRLVQEGVPPHQLHDEVRFVVAGARLCQGEVDALRPAPVGPAFDRLADGTAADQGRGRGAGGTGTLALPALVRN